MLLSGGEAHGVELRGSLVYALHLWPPQRGGRDLRGVAAVGVLSGYLGDLLQQPFGKVVGCGPRSRKRSWRTCRSFSAASLRGFCK